MSKYLGFTNEHETCKYVRMSKRCVSALLILKFYIGTKAMKCRMDVTHHLNATFHITHHMTTSSAAYPFQPIVHTSQWCHVIAWRLKSPVNVFKWMFRLATQITQKVRIDGPFEWESRRDRSTPITKWCGKRFHDMTSCIKWIAEQHGPLNRYVNLLVGHALGMPGTFSLLPRVYDPGMHHGTCVTHVPWYLPGLLTTGFIWSWWHGKRSRYSRRNAQCYVSGKRPHVVKLLTRLHMQHITWNMQSFFKCGNCFHVMTSSCAVMTRLLSHAKLSSEGLLELIYHANNRKITLNFHRVFVLAYRDIG